MRHKTYSFKIGFWFRISPERQTSDKTVGKEDFKIKHIS